MPLSRNSVALPETYTIASSHTTYQVTLSHSCPSSLSHCELILAQKSGIGAQAISTYY